MANDYFPSLDMEKLIELWQQKLEGYHKKDLKGNQLTGSERLFTINMHNFCGKEQQVM